MRPLLHLQIALLGLAAAAPSFAAGEAKNIVFFLGDGMGPTTVTATRIYKVGEAGRLHMEKLPRAARIITYSNDAMTTDSAPSMAAYMTGVKMNNEVVSMSAETLANKPGDNNTINNCGAANGVRATTLLELAKASGRAIGAVTTTRVTHATPATTYAHICHRDLENDIAAQMVPGGGGFNTALGSGLDVLMGGGRKHFLPNTVTGGFRTDGRDLVAELGAQGYAVVQSKSEFDALPANLTKVVGLFTGSHMAYGLDRNPAKEPTLAEMAVKALDIVSKNSTGYVLMVEGGRIDHALHDTNAVRALNEAVEFDDAIKAVLDRVDLANTLIVVTADHDHTLTINGYGRRTGPTTATNPGILGLVKDLFTGETSKDADGMPYTNLIFGNGEHRVAGPRSSVAALDEVTTSAKNYHQEAAIRMAAGNETHGGGDVMLMAAGAGSAPFKGVMANTAVYNLLVQALGIAPAP